MDSIRERQTFTQSYQDAALDASLLLIPLVGFLPADDPRVVGNGGGSRTRAAGDGLVLRYRTEDTAETASDGLPPGEGVFLPCSFWLADAYIQQGRREDALRLFERLLSLRNDVGLLSEEYEPRSRRLLGNFPQAFSHLSLVNTAYNLHARSDVSGPPPRRRRRSRGVTSTSAANARRVLILSNRLPLSVTRADGEIHVERSTGGLATGLSGIHQAAGSLWIGWPGHSEQLTADESESLARLFAERNVRAVDLTADEVDRYYEALLQRRAVAALPLPPRSAPARGRGVRALRSRSTAVRRRGGRGVPAGRP